MQLTLFDREPLDLKDYTIIIIPKGKAFEHISSFKQEYLEKFKAAQYISSPAHITLSTFPLKEDRELFLLYYLERLLTESQRFTINIQDFNCFKNSGLLFLNVSQPEIMSLQKEIVKVLRVDVKVAKRFTKRMHKPHITIAKTSNPKQFDESWSYFQTKKYRQSFEIDNIVILKRDSLLLQNKRKHDSWEFLTKMHLDK